MKFINKIGTYVPGLIIKIVLGMFAIKCASLLKMSFIFGSSRALFSGSAAATPLVGFFGGGLVSLAICSISILLRYLVFGIFSLHILAFYLPGLCAALSMTYQNIFFRLLLPIVCMILFIVHPVGGQAFAYSLFWLIPVAIYFVKSKNIFLHALASTFVAHAVGSVIWLYTIKMNAVVWNSLIPIVALERLAIACMVYMGYKVVMFGKNKISEYVAVRKISCQNI